MNVLEVDNVFDLVSWAVRRASCNSSIEKGLLYTSALSDETFIVSFVPILPTYVKTSVLKAEEELWERLSANALAMSR